MAIESLGKVEHLTNVDIQTNVQGNTRAQGMQTFDAIFLQCILKSACIDEHFVMEQEVVNVPSHDLFAGSAIQSNHTTSSYEASLPHASIDVDNNGCAASRTVDDFVTSIWPYAKQASQLIGVDPKVLVAQAALETGWGKMIANDVDGSSSHNLFNIKATPEQVDSIAVNTTEYIANMPIKITATFKKYASVEHSFNDYVSLISGNDRYKQALANARDPERYINLLQEAGYATDPNYSRKILSIYQGDELQRALQHLA